MDTRILTALALLISTLQLSAQTGIGVVPPALNSHAQLHIESSDRGVLIPRLKTDAYLKMTGPIPSGLWVYDIEKQLFAYYTGTGWREMGNTCDRIESASGYAGIYTEKLADEDRIHINTATGASGSIVDAWATDVLGTVSSINLNIKNGSVAVNSAYRLPQQRGPEQSILIADPPAADKTSWLTDANLPGIQLGVQTFPFAGGKEFYGQPGKLYLTPLFTTTNAKITTASIFIEASETPLVKIALYDENKVLITQGSANCSKGLASFPLSAELETGRLYYVGVTSDNDSVKYLDIPYNGGIGTYATYIVVDGSMEDLTSFYLTEKPIWVTLY